MTVRSSAWWRLLTVGGLSGLAAFASLLTVAVIWADRDAPRHSIWREPISWFGAAEAPYPELTRVALVGTGVCIMVIGLSGFGRLTHRVVPALTTLAGLLVVVLGFVPLECSIRIDFCEKLVQQRLVGNAHLVHAAAAGLLFLLLVSAAALAAWRSRTALLMANALLSIAATTLIIATPTNGRLGPLQWISLVCAAVAFRYLWVSEPRRSGVLR